MPNVTIKLTKPIEVFGKKLGAIELKEPSGGLYVRLGEPRTLVFNQSGSGYWVENASAIGAYLDQLIITEAGGEAVMPLLCLEDSMAMKEALFDFFTSAAANVNARRAAARSTPSSSAPA